MGQVCCPSELILIRPSGAPRARNTPEELKHSEGTSKMTYGFWLGKLERLNQIQSGLEALKSVAEKYGSSNVCIAGHSLGAGFALQVGKTLAKEGIYVDTHLFNPPSVSLAMSFRNIGEKAGFVWKRFKSMLPSSSSTQVNSEGETMTTFVALILILMEQQKKKKRRKQGQHW
ncbi:hypothetical protein F8388_010481 [Cannabis sativa]|uniref:Fungal lipase-type domain-containing protein n=1 Tax=Cannabis sativa TaxID=3483 RepID=A0A7J6GSP6_CANSA|nr:hypothetical protein F8388_010481 [Cannabis sativa]